MADPIKLFVTIPLKSGLEQVECFAHAPDAEIVVNRVQTYDPKDSDGFVLTHRRSGRRILEHSEFERLDFVLGLAEKLSALPGFAALRIDKLEDGPVGFTAEAEKALRSEVNRVFKTHCDELAAALAAKAEAARAAFAEAEGQRP